MSETSPPAAGSIGWLDLTVANADALRAFYASVVGWTAEPLSMGDYDDYVMKTPAGAAVAGLCHARGANAALPAVWLPYVVVEDVQRSIEACVAGGGSIVAEPRAAGGGSYCVIRDPAGSVLALYQVASS